MESLEKKFFGKYTYFFLLIIFIGIAALFSRFTSPFYGYHTWVENLYSSEAIHFLENGSFTYLNHPLLFPILLSISYKIFGVHTWSARLVPIIFGIGTILTMYLLGARLFDKKSGLICAAFCAISPYIIYFGQHVGFRILVVFFTNLTLLSYWIYLENKEKKYLYLSMISAFLGFWSDIPLLCIPIPILIMSYYKKEIKGALSVSASVVAGLFSFLLTFRFLSQHITSFIVMYPFTHKSVGLAQYLSFHNYTALFDLALRFFPLTIVFFFFVGLGDMISRKFDKVDWFILSWIAGMGIYIFFFLHTAVMHGSHMIHLIPPFILATVRYLRKFSDRDIVLIVIFTIVLSFPVIRALLNGNMVA